MAWLLCLCLIAPITWAGSLSLTSSTFTAGALLSIPQTYDGMDCKGQNLTPELTWKGIPAGTQSLALTLFDPDAPTGHGWWHWVVFNLPPATSHVDSHAGRDDAQYLPAGAISSLTDFGTPGYGGPCPPQGDTPHHYIFTLFALKTAHIPLSAHAKPEQVMSWIRANVMDSAVLVGRYGR
ncbi:MAG: YbhB/YbcL family Raf kinase inhibitor-like protein [Pseudomonadales bacterium]|nr:YbhB/YbcL family Raf kinase inhibitor-like protein [Pseudomonadales bacterium]